MAMLPGVASAGVLAMRASLIVAAGLADQRNQPDHEIFHRDDGMHPYISIRAHIESLRVPCFVIQDLKPAF
jgi:hypothetical protein